MSVIFQLAGKALKDTTVNMRRVFALFEKGLCKEPGFERAVLLVSQATMQVQFLFYWSTYEEGLVFNAKFQGGLSALFMPLLEKEATLIASVLEDEIDSASLPLRGATDTEDGPVVMQFAGTIAPDTVAKLRLAMREATPVMSKGEGFAKVELLVNHRELKAQFLLSFTSYENAIRWMKGHGNALLPPFEGLLLGTIAPFIFAIECDIRNGAAESLVA